MSTDKNTKAATMDERIDALLASDQAIIENIRELNAKITNVSASPKISPFTAFSMSLDPFLGVDLHFSAAILEKVLNDMAPIVLLALNKMRDDMMRQHMTVPKQPSPQKKKTKKDNSKSTKAKKAR